MKRRHILQLCLALLLCCPSLLKAQSNQTIFQCWINDSKDEAVYGTVNGEDINMSLDVGSLNPGVHFYNIRAYETVGNKVKWGSLFRYLFCIPKYAGEDAPNNLKSYEYWLDDDYEHRVTAAANGDEKEVLHSVDVSALAPGVHFYNMRTQDEDGMWSTLYRYLFCIPKAASTSPNNLKGYEYWIDNDYEHRVTTAANGDEKEVLHSVDVSALSPGIHFYNMRTQDEDGIWGTVNRYLFSIPYPRQDEAPRLITGYSYAFDGKAPTNVEFDSPVEEYELTKSFAVPQPQPPMVIDDDCGFIFDEDENTATLSRNINMSFALFFKDQSDAMCSPVTTEFTVGDVRTEDIQIITCPGSANIANHENGGFSAIRFDVVTKMNIKFIADGNCSMRLYSPYSQLLDGYDASTLTAGVTKELEEGTYYALVYGNTQDVVLSIGFADMNVLKPTIAFDMETYIATISCKTAGATIYYTIDGNTPTAESTLYKEPFVIDRNCTIKAIATWAGGLTGPVASKEIDIFDAAAPMIARDGNNITITCETAGATIYYTTDGTEPTAESTAYTGSFALSKSCTIKAIALKEGYNASVVTSYKFTYVQPVVTTPEIAHEGNTITITCNTEGATIYYTSDGLEPTAGSTAYTEAFEVTENCTIKAIAVKEGYKNSQIISLTVDWFVVADVTFAAAGSSLSLSTTTEGATISYKVDDLEWATYTEALSMEGTHTVQAYATKEGYTKSNVTTYNFFYERPVVTTPEIAYEGNTITITCNTEDATVYYTIDGTVPTSESAVYTTPFTVSENCTVRAFAVKEGHVDSQMAILEIVLNVGGYAIFNSSSGTLTFKYGPIPSGDNVFETENTKFSWNPSWDCSKLRTVIFDSSYAEARPTSTANWFYNATSLTTIQGIEYLNTSNVTSMTGMFQNCSSLTRLDLSHFETQNVTKMNSMFYGCSKLSSINLSSFDTQNVSTMNSMFCNCSNLTSLDVSNFNTSKVMNMSSMFDNCHGLTNLDVSKFDTSNVTDMSYMFAGCSSLTNLDLSNIKTDNVMNMLGMFTMCYKLKTLNISNFNTCKVTSMFGMFNSCCELTSLDLSHFDTSNVTSMSCMFNLCCNLTSIDVSSFDTENVTAMVAMFQYCSSLTSLDLSHFNTANVTDMAGMFGNCYKLQHLDISKFNTANVTRMSQMFQRCLALTSLDLNHFDTSNVTDMKGMFNECGRLENLNISSFNTSKVTNMTLMFAKTNSLTTLDLSSFDTNNVTAMDSLFCSSGPSYTTYWWSKSLGYYLPSQQWTSVSGTKLKTIYVSEAWNTTNVEKGHYMFGGCTSLVGGNGTAYNSSYIDYSYAHIDGGTANPGYFTKAGEPEPDPCGYAILDTSTGTLTFKYGVMPEGDNVWETENTKFSWNPSWDCSKLRTVIFDSSYAEARPTSTAYWFNGAQNLTEIRNLEYLNTSSVTNMAFMFQGCKKLSGIDVSHFETGSVTWLGCLFAECSTLTSVDVSKFNTNNVLSFNGMFAGCRKLTTIDVSHFDTSSAYDMSFMFSECNSLLTLDVGNFNTSNVTNMKGMFLGCSSLKNLDISNFDTHNVTTFGTDSNDNANTIGGMFTECSNLTILDLSNFNTSKAKSMGQMFSRCSKLHTIYVGEEWTVENVTFSNDMFKDCTSLVGERGTCYNTSYTDISYARIDGGETAPGYLSEIGFVPTTCGYAMLDSSTGTLTFKYGPMPSGDNVWETENTRLDVAGSMLWDCSKIKQVIFDSSYSIARPQSTACWFAEAVSLKEIHGIEYLNTSNVTSMQSMFYDCRSLTNLDVSHFITSNVQMMALMFFNCKNLTSLDVSNFDTKNVTNMLAMFVGCSSLTYLDVRGFDTSNVTDMSDMFEGCNGLTNLDVSHFDTHNVEKMPGMFLGCISLTELDVSNFSTTNVTDMSGMFSYCKSLTYLDLSNFDTQNVIRFGYRQDMGYTSGMFEGCQSLTSLDLSSFNTVKAEYMSYLFKGCNSLKTIYVGDGWATSNVIESEKMFEGCTNLVGGKGTRYNSNYVDAIYARIDGGTSAPGYFSLNGEIIGPCGYAIYDSGTATLTFKYGETLLTGNVFETDNTTFTFDSPAPWDCENLRSVVFDASFAQARPSSTAYWFYRASNLTQITGIEYLNTREVTGMRCMFDECKSLTSLDLSHFDTRNVTDMAGMFENCSSLTSLDMSSFDTRNVTDMGWMFFNCNALKSINLSSFNTSNVTDMSRMFYYCNGLEILNISHFDTGNVTNMAYMFSFCNSLSEIDVTHFKTDKVTSMEAMFQRCVKLKNVDVSHFETSNVTNMSYMFSICSSLTVLNLCRFNTAKVTNMNYMFQNCTNLKTIYAGLGWTTDNVTSSYNMFADCSSLVGGKGTSCLFYGYYYSDKTYARIDGRNSASGFLTGLFIGDVNDNGVVDLVDAVAMVNYILGTPSSSFKTISADINDDGEIDVFDVTMLINMILADSDEPASSRRSYDDTQEREPILLTSYGNSVYMGIDYPERFTAFQFDVTISSGVDLSDVLMVSNDNNHSLTFTKIGEDKYTVVGISLNNDLLKSANGKLVEMIFSDQLNGDVMVSNIHFVTPEEEEMYFCDGMLCVVTGIASNSEECEEIIYDLSGRKQTKSRGLLGRGVYVINGKKTVIK